MGKESADEDEAFEGDGEEDTRARFCLTFLLPRNTPFFLAATKKKKGKLLSFDCLMGNTVPYIFLKGIISRRLKGKFSESKFNIFFYFSSRNMSEYPKISVEKFLRGKYF